MRFLNPEDLRAGVPATSSVTSAWPMAKETAWRLDPPVEIGELMETRFLEDPDLAGEEPVLAVNLVWDRCGRRRRSC